MDILSHTKSLGEGSSEVADKNEIASITARVKSKHGGARPGAGRRGSAKETSGNQNMGGSTPSQAGQPETPVTEADLEFVRETAKAGLTVLDKVVCDKVYKSVVAIDIKLEPDARKFESQVRIEESEIDLVAGACKAIAQKYSIIARYAPEMMLAGWCATYGLRVTSVLKEIKALTEAVKAMKGTGNASSPQAN